jgi:hypothetical protein
VAPQRLQKSSRLLTSPLALGLGLVAPVAGSGFAGVAVFTGVLPKGSAPNGSDPKGSLAPDPKPNTLLLLWLLLWLLWFVPGLLAKGSL